MIAAGLGLRKRRQVSGREMKRRTHPNHRWRAKESQTLSRQKWRCTSRKSLSPKLGAQVDGKALETTSARKSRDTQLRIQQSREYVSVNIAAKEPSEQGNLWITPSRAPREPGDSATSTCAPIGSYLGNVSDYSDGLKTRDAGHSTHLLQKQKKSRRMVRERLGVFTCSDEKYFRYQSLEHLRLMTSQWTRHGQ